VDELVRERLQDLAERVNGLVAQVSRLEMEERELRRVLIVVLTRLKRLEAGRRPGVLPVRRRRS
jgi:hypothetical protein